MCRGFHWRADGSLGERETFIAFDGDVFPDGLEFDESGALWLTSVYSNQLISVSPDREVRIVLEERTPAFVSQLVQAFAAGRLATPDASVDPPWQRFGNLSSVAFGGRSRRRLVLGCLLDRSLYAFDVPVPGARPSHWDIVVPPRQDARKEIHS